MALKAIHAARGFKTGAKKSTRHALLAAMPFQAIKAPLPQFGIVPKLLGFWGNDTDGDCVTAEECYAKAVWSIMSGLDELFATDQEALAFANQYGYANGATLTEVMDTMKSAGMNIGGRNYKNGGYLGVDYSNEPVLQSAIDTGPVKIAIDAAALPDGAGHGNGWYDVLGGSFTDTDHCTGFSGHGSAAYLYGLMGLPVPAGLDPNTMGYLLFTWKSVGFVTHAWIMGTVVEAWVRNPTTVGQSPVPVPPIPPSPLPPAPPVPVPPVPPSPLRLPITATVTIPGTFGGLHTYPVQGYATYNPGTGVPLGFVAPAWWLKIEALAAEYGADSTAAFAALVALLTNPSFATGQACYDAVNKLWEDIKAKQLASGKMGFSPSDITIYLEILAQIIALRQQVHPPKPAPAGK